MLPLRSIRQLIHSFRLHLKRAASSTKFLFLLSFYNKKCWSMPLGIKHPDTPQQLNICRGSTTESHINGPPSHHHPNLQCHNRCCYKVQISEVEEDLQATCSSFHQRPETTYSGPIQTISNSCEKYVPNVKPLNRSPL